MKKYKRTILAIDKNIKNYNSQKKEWLKYKINIERVNTFLEAFKKIINNKNYFFIAINEDTHPDFYTYLCTLRDLTSIPIFVGTSNYTIDKKIRALNYGAHIYGRFDKETSNNVKIVLCTIKSYNCWLNQIPHVDNILLTGDLVLIPSYRTVLVNDSKVTLTPKEFDILYYLMKNNGHIVPYVQLLKLVWGDEYGVNDKNILWKRIDSIRNKLSRISKYEYIKVERGIGYMFQQQEKKRGKQAVSQ